MLRSTIMLAKAVGLNKMLLNEQTLSGIMGKMPTGDWKKWARRLSWKQGELSTVFERFKIKSGETRSKSQLQTHDREHSKIMQLRR